jgi:hypothetical protein
LAAAPQQPHSQQHLLLLLLLLPPLLPLSRQAAAVYLLLPLLLLLLLVICLRWPASADLAGPTYCFSSGAEAGGRGRQHQAGAAAAHPPLLLLSCRQDLRHPVQMSDTHHRLLLLPVFH